MYKSPEELFPSDEMSDENNKDLDVVPFQHTKSMDIYSLACTIYAVRTTLNFLFDEQTNPIPRYTLPTHPSPTEIGASISVSRKSIVQDTGFLKSQ